MALLRFQAQYPPVAKRLCILGKGARATGSARKKAIVAVARQLAVDLWRLNTGRCTAAQLGLRVGAGEDGQDAPATPADPAPADPAPAKEPAEGGC